jgi:hypothetical protein
MSDERDEDELGGGGPKDLAAGGELSDAHGGTGAGGVGDEDPGGGSDATGDDALDEDDRP